MRIDSIAQAQQMFNLNKTTATTRTMPSNFSDKLQISMVGKDIQTAKNALANAPEIREDLVASINVSTKPLELDINSDNRSCSLNISSKEETLSSV